MTACPKSHPVLGCGFPVLGQNKRQTPHAQNPQPGTENRPFAQNSEPGTHNRASIGLAGRYLDIAHYPDGSSRVLQQGHNLILNAGLGMATGCLGGLTPPLWGWAMGAGSPNWDVEAPAVTPDLNALTTPVLTKEARFSWWDTEQNRYSLTPTNTLDVRVVLLAEEGNGTLREFALVGPPSQHALFNAVIHPPIEKTPEFNLERILRITFARSDT